MRALKIVGLVVLALWMAFVTLQIVHIGQLAQEACNYAAANTKGDMLDGCR
jgi:hypothetical protein